MARSRSFRGAGPRVSAPIKDRIRRWFLRNALIRMEDRRPSAAQQVRGIFGGERGGGGGSLSSTRSVPLVDPAVLLDLEEQLGDPSLARRFAEDFLEATSVRIGRLEAAGANHDREDALDAILGVKSTAMMVGALQLANLATECEAFLRSGNLIGAAAMLADVHSCAGQTATLLRNGYLSS